MTSFGSVISYPTPAYQNLPIDSDFYQPSRFVISAITRGDTTIVTTSVAHNYTIGQQVRLLIPAPFGTYQLNEAQGFVLSVPSPTQVEIDINSDFMNAFIASSTTYPSVAQIMAIGDCNSGQINGSGITNQTTYINGSFINISPN